MIDPPLLAAIRTFRATTTDCFTRLLRRRQQYRETVRRFFEQRCLVVCTAPILCCN